MNDAHLDVSVSELQTYVTVAAELHSNKVAMSRMAVTTLTSDCKTTGTTSAHLHRTKTGKPKRGKAGAGPFNLFQFALFPPGPSPKGQQGQGRIKSEPRDAPTETPLASTAPFRRAWTDHTTSAARRVRG